MTTKPNGLEQTEAMRKLAEPWKPDNLAGFRVGDRVQLPGLEATLEVTGLQPPSLLVLRAPGGRELKASWRAVKRLPTGGGRDA